MQSNSEGDPIVITDVDMLNQIFGSEQMNLDINVDMDEEMLNQMFGGLQYTNSEIVEIELTLRYSPHPYERSEVNWSKEGF